MNRIKSGIILIILISFLSFVAIVPVTCIFKTVTGISCPACGMTRSFWSILYLDFSKALYYNLFGFPFFIFIIFSILSLGIDFILNRSSYIPKLLKFFSQYYIFILILLAVSFLFNNLK